MLSPLNTLLSTVAFLLDFQINQKFTAEFAVNSDLVPLTNALFLKYGTGEGLGEAAQMESLEIICPF